MGRARPSRDGSANPSRASQSRISGRACIGTPNRSHRSCRHVRVCRSIRLVRLALVASVTWLFPPVSFQISQASIVPSFTSPRAARSRAPGTAFSSQAYFEAEK